MSSKCRISIQCSMGPACDNVDTLVAMMNAGMNVLRINLSHGSAIRQADKYDKYCKAVIKSGLHGIELMYDLSGPDVRIAELPDGPITYVEGDEIIFPKVNYEGFSQDVVPGTEILVDDGLVRFKVTKVENNDIYCKVTMGGDVGSHKGVNVPDIELGMPFLGEQDKKDILWCIDHNIDYIAASFVRSAEDLKTLRHFIADNGGEKIKLIAKIENKDAIENFEEIVNQSDLVLVARGDMGDEIGYEKVPGAQKKIIKRCNELGVPVIVATQLLESMQEKPIPTRAEVSDIYNAVLDGADGLLVTGETASGDYPVEVVKELVKVVYQAELEMNC